ncbi:hypothetical protein Ancab_029564, partial [Ancistrocladus abbreviatus]
MAENLKLVHSQSHTKANSEVEVHDSQIINMNRVLCKSSPSDKVEQHLTPRQIWDFIEHIEVQDKTNLEEVVRRIGDMEQRDWAMFQQFASAGKHTVVDKA